MREVRSDMSFAYLAAIQSAGVTALLGHHAGAQGLGVSAGKNLQVLEKSFGLQCAKKYFNGK